MRAAALAVALALTPPAWGQYHYHLVPHTTTHTDLVRHGNHYHLVPHTTTHLDLVVHPNAGYAPATYAAYPQLMPQPVTYPAAAVSLAGLAQPGPAYAPTAPAFQPPPDAAAPRPNPAPPYSGPGVTLWLPKAVGGSVAYRLDGVADDELRAGYQHTLRGKGTYTIEFDRGDGRGVARYGLKEGTYKFVYADETGWDLLRLEDEPTPAEAVAGGLRRNHPPKPPTTAPEPRPDVVPVSRTR